MEPGQHSLSTRASAWYSRVTLGTRIVLGVCVSLYAYGIIFGYDLGKVCMQPYAVSQNWSNVYTFLTSAFFHLNILHILLNMIAFYPMGSVFERSIGTLNFLYLMLLFAVGCNLIQFCVVSSLHLFDGAESAFYSCSAGFSGVLFCILTIECQNQEGSRNLFGFSFSSRFYPWVLLVVTQFLITNVSFYGHLGGILLGYCYVYRLLEPLQPNNLLNKLEGAHFMGWFIMRNGYIMSPSQDSLPTLSFPGNRFSSYTKKREVRWRLPSFAWFSRSQPQVFTGPGRVLGTSDKFHQELQPKAPPAPIVSIENQLQ